MRISAIMFSRTSQFLEAIAKRLCNLTGFGGKKSLFGISYYRSTLRKYLRQRFETVFEV